MISPSILLSFPQDDAAARSIVGAMVESDVDLYWLRGTDPAFAERAAQARAVIYLDSADSTDASNGHILAAAMDALKREALIVVRLDTSPLPPGLERATAYDLRGWRQRASSMFMLDLVAAAKAKIAGLDPPLQRAPRQLFVRRLLFATPAIIGAFALAIGLYRDTGLDRVAGPQERAAWQARAPGACGDVQAYLNDYPDGVFAEQARSLLAAAADIEVTTQRQRVDRLVQYSTAGGANEAAAQIALDAALEAEANRQCRDLAANGGTRLQDVRIETDGRSCVNASGDTSCSAEATAYCTLEEDVIRIEKRCR